MSDDFDDGPRIARVEREVEAESQDDAQPRPSRRERLSNRLNSYEKPQRVSPEQVRQWWSQGAERRADLRDDTLDRVTSPRVWQPVIGGLSALAVGAMVWGAMSDSDHFDSQMAADKATYASLKTQASAANKKVDAVPNTNDALKILQDVQKAGRTVADGQQNYDSTNSNADKIQKVAATIRPHFTQYTLDGVTPWYSILRDKTNPYWNTKYNWEFATPYTFGNNGQSVNAVWLCKDVKDGRVLAWAIGNYDIGSKKFDGLTRGVTDEGLKRVGDAHENSNDYDPSQTQKGKA